MDREVSNDLVSSQTHVCQTKSNTLSLMVARGPFLSKNKEKESELCVWNLRLFWCPRELPEVSWEWTVKYQSNTEIRAKSNTLVGIYGIFLKKETQTFKNFNFISHNVHYIILALGQFFPWAYPFRNLKKQNWVHTNVIDKANSFLADFMVSAKMQAKLNSIMDYTS